MIIGKEDDKIISIRKRGNTYQYCFEAGKTNKKRKQITKCGFKTKNNAYTAGQKAYDEFINDVMSVECNMLYGDYLDYWIKEYFEINYKYSTAKRYKKSFKIIHHELENNCRLYDLKGNFTTKTLRKGCEIKDISKILEHSRIETTENYYINYTKDNLKDVSKSFEKELGLNTVD